MVVLTPAGDKQYEMQLIDSVILLINELLNYEAVSRFLNISRHSLF